MDSIAYKLITVTVDYFVIEIYTDILAAAQN